MEEEKDTNNIRSAIKIDNQIRKKDQNYSQFYSNLFTSPKDIEYQLVDALSDMGTFSSIIPFPKIISPQYASASFKADFGCFPEIRRFYCIIDNMLFLWSIGSKEPECITEDGTVICCVCLCGVDPDLLAIDPNIRYTLVVATPKYIKIYKIKDQIIDNPKFYLIEIKFVASCITAGPDGQIFVGADCGRIFLIKYDITDTYKSTSIASNLSPLDFTYGIFPRILSALVGYSSPSIIQIVFDSSSSYIAAIDDKNHLRFFKYDNSSSCTVFSFENSDEYEISSVCSVPTTDSDNPLFIAFCKNGTRLLIRRSTSFRKLGNALAFQVISTKDPPIEFGTDEVVCAQSFMGLTIIVGKKKVILFRGQRCKDDNKVKNKNKVSHCEYYSVEKISGAGLSIGIANSDLGWIDPLIWQHHREPPTVYLLTASGGYRYRFATPSEQLIRVVVSSHGFTNKHVINYLSKCCKKYEPVANAILSSFQHPECDDWMIYMITQYSFANSLKSSQITKGIIVRISRILEPLWDSTILLSYTNAQNVFKWSVNSIFTEISPISIKQLEHTRQWMQKYLDNLLSNTKTTVYKTSTLILREKEEIKILSSFISIVIQILSFLGYLGQQLKRLLTQLMEIWKNDKEKDIQYQILTSTTFGDCLVDFDKFVETLRDFTKLIFTKVRLTPELNRLAHQLIDNCPAISPISNAEYQVTEGVNNLADIELGYRPQERKAFFPLAVNPFIEYSESLDDPNNFKTIISNFVKMDGIPQAISIIEAKIKSLDPSNRALQYYKNNFDERDKLGCEIYNKLIDFLLLPLGIIQTSPGGIENLLNSKMEIIHIFVFFDLLQMNPEKLVLLDSPYVADFIKNYKKELLWKYYLIHKKDSLIYKEIKERFSFSQRDNTSSSEVELNEKIQMLQIALHYARNSNASIDEIDKICKSIDKINESKKKYFSNIQKVTSEKKQKMRELFDEIDQDRNGRLNTKELLDYYDNDEEYVNKIFRILKIPEDIKELTFEDIIFGEDLLQYSSIFESLLDQDDSLDKSKLEVFYRKIGKNPKENLDAYIEKHDQNNDKKLTFYEATVFLGEN